MAIWNDLPPEVRQNILENVVRDFTVRLTPRHAGTRSTRHKLDKEEEKKEETASGTSAKTCLNSLLLVAKDFITYNELEGALMNAATISGRDQDAKGKDRGLLSLNQRFGKDGLAMVRALILKYGYREWFRRAPQDLPAKPFFQSKMKNLEKAVISIEGGVWLFLDPFMTPLRTAKIAQGGSLTPDEMHYPFNTYNTDTLNRTAKARLKGMLDMLLAVTTRKGREWLAYFLDDTTVHGNERAIQIWPDRVYEPGYKVCLTRGVLERR